MGQEKTTKRVANTCPLLACTLNVHVSLWAQAIKVTMVEFSEQEVTNPFCESHALKSDSQHLY